MSPDTKEGEEEDAEEDEVGEESDTGSDVFMPAELTMRTSESNDGDAEEGEKAEGEGKGEETGIDMSVGGEVDNPVLDEKPILCAVDEESVQKEESMTEKDVSEHDDNDNDKHLEASQAMEEGGEKIKVTMKEVRVTLNNTDHNLVVKNEEEEHHESEEKQNEMDVDEIDNKEPSDRPSESVETIVETNKNENIECESAPNGEEELSNSSDYKSSNGTDSSSGCCDNDAEDSRSHLEDKTEVSNNGEDSVPLMDDKLGMEKSVVQSSDTSKQEALPPSTDTEFRDKKENTPLMDEKPDTPLMDEKQDTPLMDEKENTPLMDEKSDSSNEDLCVDERSNDGDRGDVIVDHSAVSRDVEMISDEEDEDRNDEEEPKVEGDNVNIEEEATTSEKKESKDAGMPDFGLNKPEFSLFDFWKKCYSSFFEVHLTIVF